MIQKLTDKDVEHVIDLARLDEKDIERYKEQLNDILTEIDKIIDVEIEEENIMISPIKNVNRYTEDEIGEMINKKEVLEMANKNNGEFIVVSRVINDWLFGFTCRRNK